MKPGPLLALAASLAACAGERAAQRSGATGGTLVIATSADADVLLPPVTNTTIGITVSDLVFSRLAEPGMDLGTVGDSLFHPSLAERWERRDSTRIAFHLNPSARWHDGAPVTADDVVFTFDVYRDTLVGSPARPNLAAVDSVTREGERGAVFHFRYPYPEQLYDATYHLRILPRHLLDTVPRSELAASAFGRRPVGAGPFRFVRWRAGALIELAANSDFFAGRPKLDRVIWRVLPDFSALITALVAGEADATEVVPGPANLARVRAAPQLHLVSYPSPAYVFLGFNLRTPGTTRPHPLFADREVRRALAMAVDRRSLVRAIFGEYGEVPVGPTSRMQWIWDDSTRQLPFDTARAAALLAERGWRDGDGDGIRERAGRRLAFSLLVPTSSEVRRQAAVLLQAQLRRLGAEVRIRELEFNQFDQRTRRGAFDAMLYSWTQDPSPSSMQQTWTTAGIGAGNHVAYSSAAFDSVVSAATRARSRAEARRLWREAMERINDDAPAVFLFAPSFAAAVHRRFEGVSIRPDAWLATVAQWSVPPERRIARDLTPAASGGAAR